MFAYLQTEKLTGVQLVGLLLLLLFLDDDDDDDQSKYSFKKNFSELKYHFVVFFLHYHARYWCEWEVGAALCEKGDKDG